MDTNLTEALYGGLPRRIWMATVPVIFSPALPLHCLWRWCLRLYYIYIWRLKRKASDAGRFTAGDGVGYLYARKKELGIMQAVGMKKLQVSTMLGRETLSYVGLSAICTVVLGGIMGYALVRALVIVQISVNYSYPWLPILIYIIVLAIMQWALPQFGVKLLQKKSLVERMKETE